MRLVSPLNGHKAPALYWDPDRRLPLDVHMPSHRNRRPRVLVVNGFADGRDMYVEYLRYRGYPVREATTPTAALPLVRRFRPEVIVTDFVFPDGADGVAFISSFRGMQRRPQPVRCGNSKRLTPYARIRE